MSQQRDTLTPFAVRLLCALDEAEYRRPGYIANLIGMAKAHRMPQAYARTIGGALRRLERRGLVEFKVQSSRRARRGWVITAQGIDARQLFNGTAIRPSRG